MLSGKIKAVVFDFDDTLVHYRDIYLKSHQTAAKKLGLYVPSDKELSTLAGVPWNTLIEKLWPHANREKFKKTVLLFDKDADHEPVAGALQVLEKLHGKYDLFILSSRIKESVLQLLRTAGIPAALFKGIYGPQEVSYHKPDGKVFSVFLKDYTPDELVFVGDSVQDATAANNAGILFIGFVNGNASEEEFRERGADCIIHTLHDLLALF